MSALNIDEAPKSRAMHQYESLSSLVAAIVRGLDSAFIDPTGTMLYRALKAALMVMVKDEFCK